jgi:methionyl aminopeptidase
MEESLEKSSERLIIKCADTWQMEDWLKAGRIAAEVREYSRPLVKPGASLLDIADKIEARIKALGGATGFPVNLSMNEVAAHYTADPKSDTILDTQMLKVDIGTCYNGAIGDTAYTVDLSSQYSELVRASAEALKNAEKVLAIGVTLSEIGKTIQETIESHGYRPVKNLSGHGLDLYTVHEQPSVPNYNTGESTRLREGQIIAIEPFATDGAGMIKESGTALIYSQVATRPVRSQYARDIMKDIAQHRGLPFAARWLSAKHGDGKTALGLRELSLAGNIKAYPPLVEVQKGLVSQAEHTFIINEKVINTTKSE